MKKALAFVLTLAACGDNIVPIDPDAAPPPDAEIHGDPDVQDVETWGDAEQVWADAWCLYAERCYPEDFEFYYGSYEYCRTAVQEENCMYQSHGCDSGFPRDRLNWLDRCYEEMLEIACDATMAPSVCYAAFQ